MAYQERAYSLVNYRMSRVLFREYRGSMSDAEAVGETLSTVADYRDVLTLIICYVKFSVGRCLRIHDFRRCQIQITPGYAYSLQHHDKRTTIFER